MGFKVLLYAGSNNIKKHHKAFINDNGLVYHPIEKHADLPNVLDNLIENLYKANRLFLILDPLPLPSVCENPKPRFIAPINNFLFFLSTLSKYLKNTGGQTLVILLSTFEDCLVGFPYYEPLFSAYDYTLVRLSRIHRLRSIELLQPTKNGSYQKIDTLKIYLTHEKMTLLKSK